MVALIYDGIKIKSNIRRTKPYAFDTNVEDIIIENLCLKISIKNYQLYTYVFIY